MKSNLSWKKNQEIRSHEVRLTGDNVKPGIYKLNEALQLASDLDLDLILININPTPPICKIGDYNKMVYEEKRKLKDLQKKSRLSSTEVKQIRLTPNISEGDIKHKVKSAIEFLNHGDKVKFVLKFRGRQISHSDIGHRVLLDIATRLEDIGIPESMPKLEGKNLQIQFKPRK
jgi:translation initiation factor IF-3